MMLLMLLWRVWHVRNEVVHQKTAPPVEASRRFLESYVQSLLMIKHNPDLDVAKGKHVIANSLEVIQKQWRDTIGSPTVPKPWSCPAPGWHKLNVDGSFALQDGGGVLAWCCGIAMEKELLQPAIRSVQIL